VGLLSKPVGRLICAGGVFALGAIFLAQTLMIREPMGNYVLGPRALPGTLSVILMILGAVLVVQEILAYLRENVEYYGEEQKKQYQTEFLMAVAVFAYLVVMWLLGYHVANFLFSASIFYFFGRCSIIYSLVVGLIIVLSFYFIFGIVLGSELLTGIVW
jgi:hypothetical protein